MTCLSQMAMRNLVNGRIPAWANRSACNQWDSGEMVQASDVNELGAKAIDRVTCAQCIEVLKRNVEAS